MYCTNCGENSNKKICSSCGVKKDKIHKYCKYCGSELNENASICTNCSEKIQNGFGENLLNVIDYILIIIGILFGISCFYSKTLTNIDNTFSGITFILMSILLFPKIRKKIKELYYNKKSIKNVLYVLRIVLIVILFCLSFAFFKNVAPKPNVYKEEATEVAEYVFHQNVQLKNEESYILNDSDVKYDMDLMNDENSTYTTVKVVLDYSAQNGFGGYARKKFVVRLKFDKETGQYYDEEIISND